MTEPLRFPKPPPEDCSETTWQKWVKARAKQWGWRENHTYRAQLADGSWRTTTTAKGFPDLTLVRAGRLVYAELKDAKRKVEPEQDEWLDALAEIPCAEVHVWRPKHWRIVVLVLAPGPQPET